MSGHRHHVIPKFLLKGFTSRTKSNQLYTIVYLKNKTYESNIINVGVDKDFYVKKNKLDINTSIISADDSITGFENKYARIISIARTLRDDEKIEPDGISDLIAHLCVRTKVLRGLLLGASNYLVEQTNKYFSDFNHFENLIKNNLPYLKKKILDSLDCHPLSKAQKEILVEFAISKFLPSYLNDNQNFLKDQVKMLTDEILKKIPESMKETQLDVLINQPSPKIRAEEYRRLNWFVIEVDFPLILGDSCCLFKVNNLENLKSIDDKDDFINLIFLPISPYQLIIGSSDDRFNDKTQLANLNSEISRCSQNFFISSEKSTQTMSLVKLLGNEMEFFLREQIEQIVSDYFSEPNSLGLL